MDFSYPNVLNLFRQHLDPSRNESAAFLIWYLENYFRLGPLVAADAICDQRGDKGIDGIWVDDQVQTIHVFQARLSQSSTRTVGDTALKEFAGTLQQLKDRESISRLLKSAEDSEVAALIQRLNLLDKIADYEIVGEYLTNIACDSNGADFLGTFPQISFIGPDLLGSTYISDERDVVIHEEAVFDVSSFQVTEYIVDDKNKALIAPISARDLLKLDGISNQSIFTYNVRGPLGSTNVNKDIATSVRDNSLHKVFPLFHNGVTIIAGKMDASNGQLKIADYFVVNGCQSLIVFDKNKNVLTDNLYVLTKFVQVDPSSQLANRITEYSNNQNGVKPRDFKANNSTQIRLKNEFSNLYADLYAYSVKRGEPVEQGVTIANEDAGLYLMAFDLRQPWATHRKYQVFDDKHAELFSRPGVTADRIVLLQILKEEIDETREKQSENTLFWKHLLSRYLMLYLIREILESDEQGRRIIETPEIMTRHESERCRFRKCIKALLGDLVVDMNSEVGDEGENFDYRGKLRDEEWVKSIRRTLVNEYKKMVRRGRVPSFAEEWQCQDQKHNGQS